MLNKQSIYFSATAISMNIVTMIANLVTIRWIAPENIGLWNGYFIFVSYVYFIQLGVINGLSRELPFYLGRKKTNIAISLAKTSLSVVSLNTIITIAFGILFVVYMGYRSPSFNYSFYTSISIVFLMAVQFYNNYLLSTYRSNNSFKKLSNIYLVSCLIIVGTLILVTYYGFIGHIIRIPLIAISQVVLLHIYRPYKIKPRFKIKFFKMLISTGIPIFVFGYLTGLANTFNRLVILQVGTTLQMGLYSPALAVITAMRLIPVTLSQYIYPKFSFMAGELNSKQIIWKLATKVSLYMFLILIPITTIGYFLIPIFIKSLFPNYIEGTFAAQLATIAGLFSGVSVGFVTSLNTMKAFRHIGLLSIIRAIIFYGIIFIFAINMEVLDGVAYGVLFSEISYFILAVSIARHFFKSK